MIKVSVIFGTRPEAVKLCPLVLAMQESPDLQVHVCVTGQHREMLDQVLEAFGIVPDVDLRLMRPRQTLADLTSRAIAAVDRYLAESRPDMVIVQGDTTTTFCASLAAFYRRILLGHVEAGLRTANKFSPFPEEINRVLTSRLADYHFAPTQRARRNLLEEGVADEKIFVTGNTVVDALLWALEKIRRDPPRIPDLPPDLLEGNKDKRLVLVTGHRRENFGRGLEAICRAISSLALRFPDVALVYPVHLNPNVQEPVRRLLSRIENVYLTRPLDYLPFVALMDRAAMVLTDSGGVQEEASSLGKPVLLTRDTTDRPEGVGVGAVRLVGTDAAAIVENAVRLLNEPDPCAATVRADSPYGDGRACQRIVAVVQESLVPTSCLV